MRITPDQLGAAAGGGALTVMNPLICHSQVQKVQFFKYEYVFPKLF